MTTSTSAVSAATVTVAVCCVAVLISCTPKPNGPEPAADKFLAALEVGDTSTASQLTDRPDDARAALNAAWSGLQATRLDAQRVGARFNGDTGSVAYRYTWHLPKDRTWSYDGALSMERNEGKWQVRWTATDVNPKLGEAGKAAMTPRPQSL